MSRVKSSYKSIYGCKSINVIEKEIKKLMIDYINFLSSKTGIELSLLYSLFFVSTKKPKKTDYVSLRDNLVNRLNFDFETLNVKINENNLYEQIDTGFIISQEKDRLVVQGKKSDGEYLTPLTKQDIEVCKKYNLFYEIPSNLFTHTVVRETSSKNDKIEKLYQKLKHGTSEDSSDDEEEEQED